MEVNQAVFLQQLSMACSSRCVKPARTFHSTRL